MYCPIYESCKNQDTADCLKCSESHEEDSSLESYYEFNNWEGDDEEPEAERPYIIKRIVTHERRYNPKYGDDRICECGHTYYRHFDSYEHMAAYGCKYCNCFEFKERKEGIDGQDSNNENNNTVDGD
jgi:hypothetical protein